MATSFATKSKITTMEQRTAIQFKRWLRSNPRAPKSLKIQKFDEICDEVRGR
jgi:hypothetical protein